MLIAILMNVCLLDDPSNCKTERIDIPGSPTVCAVTAQPAVAEWIDDHPQWRVVTWTCRAGEG